MPGPNLHSEVVDLPLLSCPSANHGGLFRTSRQSRLRGQFSVVDPDTLEVNEDIVRLIPEHLARRYNAIPLAQEGSRLIVAMMDPENVVAIDDLQLITGFDIEPVMLDCGRPANPILREAIELSRIQVKAQVSGPAVSVKITQTYQNKGSECLETVFVFAQPPQAMIHEILVECDGAKLESYFQDPCQSVDRPISPEQGKLRGTFLKVPGGETLGLSVGPLEPGQSLTFAVVYSQCLDWNGQAELSLPLPLLPQGADIEVNILIETGGVPLQSLACSYPCQSRPVGPHQLEVFLPPERAVTGNFLLRLGWQPRPGQGALFSHQGHFLLWMPTSESGSEPQDLVVFVDSGLAPPDRQELIQILAALRPCDRFALALYGGGGQQEFFAEGRWCSPSQLEEALSWLKAKPPKSGKRNLLAPLGWLLALAENHIDRELSAVVVGAGPIADKDAVLRCLEAKPGGLTLSTVAVGPEAEKSLLRSLARQGEGTFRLGAVSEPAFDVGPAWLRQISLTDRGLHSYHLTPLTVPALAAHGQLLVYGRQRGEGDLILQGRKSGHPWTAMFSPQTSSNFAIAKLWARSLAQELEDSLALAEDLGQAQELRKLGFSHALTTQFSEMRIAGPAKKELGAGGDIETRTRQVLWQVLDQVFQPEPDAEIPNQLLSQDDPPSIRLVDLIINLALKDRASHIHIEPEAKYIRVRFRVDGVLHEAMTPSKFVQGGLLYRIKRLAEIDLNQRHLPQKGQLTWRRLGFEYLLEVSTCPTLHGERVVITINNLDFSLPIPTRLGLEPTVRERLRALVDRERGLILVAGPPASGRSTMIASQLARCASSRNGIFCDSRWKTPLPGIQQIQLNRQAGFAVDRFLPQLIEQDCDLLGVCDLLRSRDLEALCEFTTERGTALAAWPSQDAAGAFISLCGTGIEPHLLSSAISGILSLRLLPTLCECKIEEQDHDVLTRLLIDEPVLRKRNGCERCHMTGVQGRTLVAELLIMNDSLRALLHKCPTSDEVRAASAYSTLFEQALGLARKGVIEARDCLALWPSLAG